MYVTEWANAEKSILNQQIKGPLSAEEMRHGLDQIYILLDSVNHKVFIVTTVSQWLWLPKEFGSIARDFDKNVHDNLALHIIVGNSHTLRIGMNLLSIVAPRSFQFARVVSNQDEAYKLIAQYQQRVAI